MRVEPKQLDSLLHPTFDFTELKNAEVIAKGLPASPGAACGKVAFSAEEAKERAEKGEKVVLVRLETSPEDIEGMIAAEGILTIRGGMTSHAAVVARGMGTCCVAGCGDLKVNEEERTLEANGKVYTSEDYISIDGSTGNVYGEAIKAVTPEISGHFATFMEWADNIRKLSVRTNAKDKSTNTINKILLSFSVTAPLGNGRFLVRSTLPSIFRSAKSFITHPAARIENTPIVKTIRICQSGKPLAAIHKAQ